MTVVDYSELSDDQLRIFKSSQLDALMKCDYRFTESMVSYYLEYFKDSHPHSLFLIVYHEENPVMTLRAQHDGKKLTYFGMPVEIFALDSYAKDSTYKALWSSLDEIVKAKKLEEIVFLDSWLSATLYGKITSWDIETHAIVDLNMSNEEIKTAIRKSYKSLVNWGERNLETIVLDKNSLDRNRFDSFRDFHIETSGRMTRSYASWDLQWDAICKGDAFVVMGYLDHKMVSSSYVVCGSKVAYYGVGVYNRELMAQNVGVAHYGILYCINHAKKLGLNTFDLGYIARSQQVEKELNIFNFKKGFSNTLTSHVIMNAKFL